MIIKPVMVGEIGEMKFMFSNGKTSKSFYNAGVLDDYQGVYPILDKEGNVVEYMDLLGQFSPQPTDFASSFHYFAFFERYSYLIMRNERMSYYDCAINHFPSKYLIDERMVKIAREIERNRFQYMCKHDMFVSIFDKLSYRLYMKKCFKIKLERAKYLSQDMETVEEITESTSQIIDL